MAKSSPFPACGFCLSPPQAPHNGPRRAQPIDNCKCWTKRLIHPASWAAAFSWMRPRLILAEVDCVKAIGIRRVRINDAPSDAPQTHRPERPGKSGDHSILSVQRFPSAVGKRMNALSDEGERRIHPQTETTVPGRPVLAGCRTRRSRKLRRAGFFRCSLCRTGRQASPDTWRPRPRRAP